MMSSEMRQATARVFLILGSDSSVLAFAPLRTHQCLQKLFTAQAPSDFNDLVSVRQHAPELGDLINCSRISANNSLQLDQCVGSLIEHLLVFLRSVHGADVDPKASSPMAHTTHLRLDKPTTSGKMAVK